MGEQYAQKYFLASSQFRSVSLFCNMYMLLQLRNPKDVTTEEYNEFFRKTFNEYLDPLASSHFTTEVLCYLSDSICGCAIVVKIEL